MPKLHIKNICKGCNKTFTANYNKQKYCSGLCYGKLKKEVPIKFCELCSNQLKISPKGNITYFMKMRFCSPHCRGVFNAAPRKKRNTFDDRWQRWLFTRDMRSLILKRDNYICQLCSKKGGYLQVDHIQSWAKYPELRFDLNNCRTLCMDCHYKITYGKLMPITVKAWGLNFSKRRDFLF